MDEFRKSRQQVSDNGTITLPRADGAHGRRHLPRGLYGYWSPPKKDRPVDVETVLPPTHSRFIGYKLIKKGV